MVVEERDPSQASKAVLGGGPKYGVGRDEEGGA